MVVGPLEVIIWRVCEKSYKLDGMSIGSQSEKLVQGRGREGEGGRKKKGEERESREMKGAG